MTACRRLRNFPDISKNITQFSISVTDIEQVSASIKRWSHLLVLNIITSGKLKPLTNVPQSLRHQHICYPGVEKIPDCKKSYLWFQLYINSCKKLASLPDPLGQDCESMKTLTCPYETSYVQLNYTNCFKLDKEAQKAIINQSFIQGWACLPGKEVPLEFDHRARGASLTIRLMSNTPLTIFKVCVVISTNQQIRESKQLLCRRISKGEDYLSIDEISVYTIPRIQSKHLFLFHSYLFEEERFCEETSRDLVFEFSSKLEIMECGVQIWKDESERNNNGGYQTVYDKAGSCDKEDVGDNQQDTYELREASDKDEVYSISNGVYESESIEAYEDRKPAKRMKR